ncbi:hypothetical protein Bca52824_021494 [Brassica carinata]|uniref:Uncharacterized protein n=1 Tax=Brassica carinata TaxID=52824 RepID=A0A8X8ARW0_BRACI|nr:hypothetical protein Bca52824_021494 [Brassica carinata]
MNFRSANIDEFELPFQTSSIRNAQHEPDASNPALRALFSLQLLQQPPQRPLTTVNLNARPHNPHKKDVDAMLLSFDLIKSLWFWYGNAKVQRLGSIKTSALSSHLIIFSVYVKVNSTSNSELTIGSAVVAHKPKVQFIHLFLLAIVCLGKLMFVIISRTVTTSLFFLVTASFALPDEVSRTGVYGSTLSDQATLMKSLTPAAQAPTMSTVLFLPLSKSPMEWEKKRVSIVSPSRLPIYVLSGSVEIHLVSRSNIDGYRTVLFRLTGALPLLFKPLSLGYFNVFLDYLKLSRAVVLRIQVKIIRGSLYFELISPLNTSIPCSIVFMFLLFILPSSLPPVVNL